MSPLVVKVSRWARGLLLLYGLHMVLHGHLSPGGGFSGGVMIAAAFGLVLLAEGRGSPLFARARRLATPLYCLAALAFLGVAVAGLWLGAAYFDNFIATPPERWFALDSSGTILLSNVIVGIGVASGVTLALAALAGGYRTTGAADSDEEAQT